MPPAANKDAPQASLVDPTVSYIEARVGHVFKNVPIAKFKKSFDAEENASAIQDFLTTSDKTYLLFSGENINAYTSVPKKLGKGKSVFFVKTEPCIINKDNFFNKVIFTEVDSEPVANLSKISEEVYLPLLSNAANSSGWGEMVAKDVMAKFQSYMSVIAITGGHLQGKPVLPLPHTTDDSTDDLKNKISLLEGAIVTWTKQIKNVLKQDPEALLKQGLDPTPERELEFWKVKAGNLNFIFDQLQKPTVRKVLKALDQSKSTYCTTFARLCKEVFAARLEGTQGIATDTNSLV